MEVAMRTTDYRDESSRQARKPQASQSAAKVASNHSFLPTTLRFRVSEAVSNPDFVAVALFSAIGLLATMNLILRIPDIGVM
jgi:hypothetical protein